MKINALILILFFSISVSSRSQGFQDILGEASSTIRYKLPDSSSLKRIESSYFDFDAFEKKSEGDFKCDLFYQEDNLVEIRFSLNNQREYRIFLYPSKLYTFYNIHVKDKGSSQGFFAPGFFIHSKKDNRNIFIGLTLESLASLSLGLDKHGSNIDWGFKALIDANSINRIIMIDKYLNSVSNITFRESELLTYSKYYSAGERLIEEVHVYSSRDCEDPTSLPEMSLDQIYSHLEEDFCTPALIFISHPKLIEVDFLWGDLFRKYD